MNARILLVESYPLAEVRQDLSKFVESAVTTHARIDITRNGKRAAVLLSADDYDALVETLDVLSDRELVAELHEAIAEVERGEVFTHEQIVAEFEERRRRSTEG